jgi:hypothetical protein
VCRFRDKLGYMNKLKGSWSYNKMNGRRKKGTLANGNKLIKIYKKAL